MSQNVLITGANRGIGHALARLAAERGDRVVGTARSAEGCAAIEALRAFGDVSAFMADATDPERSSALADMLADRPVDILICNAGALIGRGGIEDPAYTRRAFETVLMTNVAGPFFTVRGFLPLLRKSSNPRVAIISSGMGSSARAKGNAYLYRASKAAATNLAANLAVELKPMGVAVAAYHPGWVRTEMGGAGAELTPDESAAGLLARLGVLSLATTGAVEDYAGASIPF
ncbi:MAG: SDR family oxidoreductase [Rhodobacteraceae bacterium]|nr:MAG: SDR family oxidoreductase [Paracoccaceae bacterium]